MAGLGGMMLTQALLKFNKRENKTCFNQDSNLRYSIDKPLVYKKASLQKRTLIQNKIDFYKRKEKVLTLIWVLLLLAIIAFVTL